MKFLKRESLTLKLAVSTIVVILLTFTFATFYNIIFYSKEARIELEKALNSQAIASNVIVNNNVDQLKQISNNIASDSALSFSLQMNIASQIEEFLEFTASKNAEINDFYIVTKAGDQYRHNSKDLFSSEKSSISPENITLLNLLVFEANEKKRTVSGFWRNEKIEIVIATPIMLRDGSIIGTVILVQDISKQEKNFETLAKEIKTNFLVFDRSELIILSYAVPRTHEKESRLNYIKEINYNGKDFIFDGKEEEIAGRSYYVLYIPILNLLGEPIGSFAVARESAELKNALRSITRNMLYIGFLASITGALLIMGLTNLFLSPLRKFVDTLQEIGDGNYSKRVKISSKDEIGVLSFHFNEMISQLENNIDEIGKKNNRLKELDRLKDDFLANTSHELRTPLNGIIGLSEALLEGVGGELTPKIKFNLSMITSSSKRLVNLVNDILDFAKIKNNDLEVSLKDIDVYQIVSIVAELMRPLIGTKEIELINKIPKNFPIIYGDDNRVEQILYNLLGNAIKFTAKGTISISASVNDAKDTAKFIIKDTGIGIPKEQIHSIFESFQQGDSSVSRKYGGTGLGLSITKKLVELQGGEIYVESIPGEGSTFVFTLPISDEVDHDRMFEEEVIREQVKREQQLREKVEAEEQKHLTQDLLPKFNPNSSHRNILLIDDEYVNLQVLVDQLLIKNYNIDVAMSGEEALEKIEINEYDLLILDVMMPRMSGYEVCERVRQKYSLFELPILMLTAKNRHEDIIMGLESGANDYLVKPFEKKELYARISTLLTLKHAVDVSLETTHEYLSEKQKSDTLETLQKITNEFNSDLNPQKILMRTRSLIKDVTNFMNFQYMIKRQGKYYVFDVEKDSILDVPLDANIVPFEGNPYIKFVEQEKIFTFIKNTEYDLFMNKKSSKTNSLILPAVYGDRITGIIMIELVKELEDEEINFLHAIHIQAIMALQNAKLLFRIADEVKKVEEAMQQLQVTQEQLILSEKMAVLGGLVAGIAHEINTPIGIGVTAASTLEESTRHIHLKYSENKMSRSDLERYLDDADTSSKLILSNLNRASDLVKSFKQISVDQSSEEKRKFKVNEYLNEVLISLRPKLKKTQHEINIVCDENLVVNSYPGEFSQIITNLIMNSLMHAFDESYSGKIDVLIEKYEDNNLKFIYKDNGKGMDEEHRKKIFDPFFTTKRNQGGSGLGMHIIYNIVTQKLNGKIKCISSLGNGVEFEMILPMEIK